MALWQTEVRRGAWKRGPGAYFARRYGFTVLGAIQPADFTEPSPREVAKLIVKVRELGVTMIAAALVVPPIVARQFTGSFSRMMVLSPLIGAAAGALGIYLSWFIDVSSGASVVLVATGFFVVSLAYASARDRLLRRAARSVSFTR